LSPLPLTGQVGGAIGLALLATISTERTQTLLDQGESTASALTGGYHVAYLIGAGLAVVAIVSAVTILRAEKPAAMMAEAHGEPAPHDHGAAAAEPAYSSDAA